MARNTMTGLHALHATIVAGMVVFAALAQPALAQNDTPDAPVSTSEEVQGEVSEAMDALGDYTAEQRDQALQTLDEALDTIDSEIEKREQFLREGWADMSEATRAATASALANMRTARNELGTAYGRLEAGADDAWSDLKAGVSDAWNDLQEAWSGTGTEDEGSADGMSDA